MRYSLTLAATLFLISNGVFAHVTVSPLQSQKGAKETYTLNVPTEGASATTSVELDVPADVTLLKVIASHKQYRMVKVDGRVVRVTWQVEILPGQGRQLVFIAQNPSAGMDIAWKVHQLFADGTRRDWVEAAGSHQPAPRTQLALLRMSSQGGTA